MSRALWFAAGASVGVYAMTKARRAAEALTPDGLADRLAGLSVGLRVFGDEVRAGMAEKENDLRGHTGLTLHVNIPEVNTPELTDGGGATREGND